MDFKKNPPENFKSVHKMDVEAAQNEIEALRTAIDYHDHRYYVDNDPEISDARYDKLYHRLEDLEEAFPELFSETSPTQRVGAKPVSKLKKAEHAAAMLSLNAAIERTKIHEFYDFVLRRIEESSAELVLEPKFDGFSVELVYEKGLLQHGTTRGDGRVGEDITHNLKTIRAVPLRLQNAKDRPDFLAVRAEVFMPKKGFQQLNKRRIENGEEPFANPRNAAAGTMRQLDARNVADKPLDILYYDVLSIDGHRLDSHWEMLNRFSHWGLKTDPRNRKCSDFEGIVAYYEAISEEREDLDYDIDGIVIKLNRYDQREKLGVRQRSPRWAFAWKFSPKEEVTRLEEIVVQVGRTGMLTPVALLQPVNVGGVTVSRATLHNEDEVRKKDVRPGDQVRIARAGDVIPEVVERVAQEKHNRKAFFSMPNKCPACNANVYREGAYYFCPDRLKCPPQVIGGIIHYASRNALNIDGLGAKTAEDMVKKGMVGDISDLYRLSEEDLLNLEGFAAKSANQLYEALQNSKNPTFDRFLYGLGIRHVGQRAARILTEHFGSLEALRKGTREELENIPEIGPEIAGSVREFFERQVNRNVLEQLAERGVQVQATRRRPSSGFLEGKTFVFTGKLDAFTRKEAEDLVERNGGRTTSSVSGETDYVVAGDNPGSKYENARKQNVPILDEKEFKKMLG